MRRVVGRDAMDVGNDRCPDVPKNALLPQNRASEPDFGRIPIGKTYYSTGGPENRASGSERRASGPEHRGFRA